MHRPRLLDSAIQRISIRKTNSVIHWIDFCLVDSTIHRLNNRGQEKNYYDPGFLSWGMLSYISRAGRRNFCNRGFEINVKGSLSVLTVGCVFPL